jgi:GNAT superfamily N-acetyltransferase
MLGRLSYEPSGVIRNLDPGDPELVFVKKFVTPAGFELRHEPAHLSSSPAAGFPFLSAPLFRRHGHDHCGTWVGRSTSDRELRSPMVGRGSSHHRGCRRRGWLGADAINLGQLYIDRRYQRQGIGQAIIALIAAEAARDKRAITLGVVKINPARRLYERLGFEITHEDEYKLYMRETAQA